MRSLGLIRVLAVLLCLVWTVLPASAEPQTRDRSPSFLRISLDPASLDMVTSGSDNAVVVSGEIENFSDRPVTEVEARLQRAPAVLDATQLGVSLAEPEETYDTLGPFQQVADRIPAHGKARFHLALPLRGQGDSLQIPNPGVYPMLVNVNGTPDSGVHARLDDLRFLLPVLGLPSTKGEAAQPAKIDHPTRLGIVVPLADHPRWAAGSVEGGGLVRLTDDELANELVPDGRLGVLVEGLDALRHAEEQTRRSLRQAICVAVDPDLLRTVNAMTGDYLVPGPQGGLVLGKGSAAARDWLAKLRSALVGQCVTALPFAHADLAALAQIGDPKLLKVAFDQAEDYVDNVLSVASVRDLMVAANTRIDKTTIEMLAAKGFHTVLTPRSTDRPEEGRSLGPGIAGVHFDSAISALLGDLGNRPGPSSPPGDPVAQRQSAVAAVLWPALQPSSPGQLPTTGGLELLVPPAVWSPSSADLDALVFAASIALQAGIAKPISWNPASGPRAFGGSASASSVRGIEVTEPKTLAKPLAGGLVDDVGQARGVIGELVEGVVDQPDDPITSERYEKGWEEQLLRVLSGGPSAAGAQGRMDELRAALDSATGSVRLVDPGKPYTLFTEQGSLPVVVRNGLPVSMRVQFTAKAPSGVEVSAIAPETVPAHGSRVLSLPAKVKAPKLSPVQIELQTISGLKLGNPVTVSVQSGRYTGLLAVITALIGGLLLTLMGLRLWRRLTGKGRPGGRLKPDEHDRKMAGLGFKERAMVESRHGALPPDED
ncbi:DUF6049 family protein [Segniliparus rugosus]|uniref:Glycoprotein n=1 Tax=Segniliparus rugosus (strain ATCC BAA-974 / DSM 45345 / CCUG 50838 / CIP 108380 / JCM 13579 / CDC 945) TaxID=679197 RepID=E5XVA2_SEGRC|nr:DUF6049 family protein [Segniliparus rugosus]EFV11715.1 hypothetical protein HMPREF9336_03424 [Segniliparus rugosus ATCC BAA-974]